MARKGTTRTKAPVPARRPAITQQALDALGTRFRAAFAQGDYEKARGFAAQAWEATHSPQPLADVALCLLRLGQPQQAYHLYLRIVGELGTANTFDGLAEAAGQLGKRDEVRRFGSESLRLKMLARHDQLTRRVNVAMLDAAKVLTPEQRQQMAEHMRQFEQRRADRGGRGDHESPPVADMPSR